MEYLTIFIVLLCVALVIWREYFYYGLYQEYMNRLDEQREQFNIERQQLLDRVMAHDWQSYKAMTIAETRAEVEPQVRFVDDASEAMAEMIKRGHF